MTENRFLSLTFQRAIHLRIAIIVLTGISGLTAMVFLAKGLKTFPDSMCPLYANLTVQNDTNHKSRNIEISHWGQASACQFVIYLYVYVFINTHIWLWIIIGSDLRYNQDACTATSRDNQTAKKKHYLKSKLVNPSGHNRTLIICHLHDKRGALFLLPFLGIHIVLVVACTLSLILVTNGLSTFCDNLRKNSNENVTCLDLQPLKLTVAKAKTYIPFFYSSVIKGKTFAWLTLLCLIAQVIVTLAQIQTSLNYALPTISVSPALSRCGLSPSWTAPTSPARSLSSVSMSLPSPLQKSSASLSPPTGGDHHLSETYREETESSNILI